MIDWLLEWLQAIWPIISISAKDCFAWEDGQGDFKWHTDDTVTLVEHRLTC
jgi:hypothetical protein